MDKKMLGMVIREEIRGALDDIVLPRFESLESKMDGMENRMDGMENRMDGMENRMDGMESKMDGMEKVVDRIENEVGEIKDRLVRVEKKQDIMIEEFSSQQEKQDRRIDKLEVVTSVVV